MNGECRLRREKFICKISKVIIVALLPIVLLLSILQVYTFNKNFYLKEFKKYNIVETTKIELEDLDKITVKMIGYLKNKENNLNIKVEINRKISEVFGEREKEHMIDVKKIFQKGHIFRNTGFLFLIISIFVLIKTSKNIYIDIYKSLLGSSIISLVAMLLLFILIKIDFYKYFTYFHKIFFDNDLWILDEKTDVLLQMLPLGFFIDISTIVISWFVGIILALGILSFSRLRRLQ